MPWDKKGNPDCDPACCGGEGCVGEICAEIISCDGEEPIAGHTIEIRQHDIPHDLVTSGVTNSSGYVCLRVPPGTYDVTRKGPVGIGPQYQETRTTTITEGCETVVLHYAVPTQLCVKAKSCGNDVSAHWTFTGGYADQDGNLGCVILNDTSVWPITATGTVDGIERTYTWTTPVCQLFPPVLDFTPDESCFTILSCAYDADGEFHLPLDGAYVELTFGDGSIVSGVTDETGAICLSSSTHAGNPCNLLVQCDRYRDYTFFGLTLGCGGKEVVMIVADGYYCCPTCVHPTKDSWSYTDSGGTENPYLSGTIIDDYSACSDVPWSDTKYGGPCLNPDPPKHVARSVRIQCDSFFDGGNVYTTKKFRVSISWKGVICAKAGPIDPETGLGTTVYEAHLLQNACNNLSPSAGYAVIGLGLHQDITYDDPCFADPPAISGSWPATVTYYESSLGITFTFDCPVAGSWVATES